MTEDPGHAAPPLAVRYGLVRPAQGRYVAGVSVALGRATRTDPVLWRVVLAVLVCFAGLGALIYLLVWLLTPEEGDTGAPLESLLGRGRSSTSPVLTGVLGIVVVGLLSVILPRPFYLMIGGALVVVVGLLINRVQAQPAAGDAAGAAGGPAEPVAGEGGWPAGGDATGGAWVGGAPAGTPGGGPGAAGAAPGAAGVPAGPGAPWGAPAPTGASAPVGAGAPGPPPPGVRPVPTGPAYYPPPGAVPAGYRPPFAPHGPFAGPPPPPPPPPPPRPPRPPRERSALPALALFATVVVLGVLGILDLLQVAAIPVAAYLAASLAVLGTGLVVGAWWGRARVLIALGAVLALALPVAHAAERWEPPQYMTGDYLWLPANETELQDEYSLAFGSGVLDLRQIDPAGGEVEVTVRVIFGEVEILVPDGPAVEAVVENRFSSAQVLDERSEGFTQETIRDPGSGDPADGTLLLDLEVQFGSVVVSR